MLVKSFSGVNVTNNFQEVFSYESVFHSFHVLKVWVSIFFCSKDIVTKCASNYGGEIDPSTQFFQHFKRSFLHKVFCAVFMMLVKSTLVLNFNLRAAFALIFFQQKITNPYYKPRNTAKNIFVC